MGVEVSCGGGVCCGGGVRVELCCDGSVGLWGVLWAWCGGSDVLWEYLCVL